MAEEVAKAAARGGYKHAALLGARFTMSGPVYPEAFAKHALKISTPTEADQQSVDDIIFEEFVNGIFSEASRLRYDEVINRMKARGCDGVIPGCASGASHHHCAQNTPALVDAQIQDDNILCTPTTLSSSNRRTGAQSLRAQLNVQLSTRSNHHERTFDTTSPKRAPLALRQRDRAPDATHIALCNS
jgi:hypothetical protein